MVASLILWVGGIVAFTKIHSKSQFKPGLRISGRPPQLENRTVLSLSVFVPFVVLAFVVLLTPIATILASLLRQGFYSEAFFAFWGPLLFFVFGYSYFKKATAS